MAVKQRQHGSFLLPFTNFLRYHHLHEYEEKQGKQGKQCPNPI
ncbi:MAG: hypothetical protein V7L14_16920 [Nostoc sp.]